jgi:hypothetical protein
MRRKCAVVAVVLILLFSAFSVTAQNSPPDVKSSVEQVLRRQQEAWNHHDLEGFMSGYWNSPDLTFFSAAQKTSGWQSTLERYRKELSERRPRYGPTGVFRLEHSGTGARCGLRARRLAPDHVRWQNASRPVHTDLPQVSRGMENRARSHFG